MQSIKALNRRDRRASSSAHTHATHHGGDGVRGHLLAGVILDHGNVAAALCALAAHILLGELVLFEARFGARLQAAEEALLPVPAIARVLPVRARRVRVVLWQVLQVSVGTRKGELPQLQGM